MASIGSLLGILGLDTARFQSGLKRARTAVQRFRTLATKSFKRVSRSFDNMAKKMGRYAFQLLTVAGPAVMGLYIRESFKMVDAQAKLSDTLGISIKSLVGFELAGKRTGATIEQVKKSLERMAINTLDAARGIGEAAESFDSLGISPKKFIQLNLDEQFLFLSDALKKVDNATLKLGISWGIFGRQGTNMVKMLDLGSETLKMFIQRAIDLNIAIDRFDAAKIETANDAMMEANEAMKGVSNTIAIKLAPFLTNLANKFVDGAMESKGFGEEVTTQFNNIVGAAGKVADAWRVMNLGLMGGKALILSYAEGVVLVGTMAARMKHEFIQLGREIGGNSLTSFEDTPIGAFVKKFSEGAEEARVKLMKLATQPMPSTNLEKWVADVVQGADEIEGAFDGVRVVAEAPFFVKLFREIDMLNLSFENVFLKFDEGLDGMADAFKRNLQKMIAELLASKLAEIFFPTQSGGFGGIVKKLFGAQHGADFTVGGGGGTDSNLVAFKATRGERVTVTPAGQRVAGAGGGVVFHNEYDFRGSSLDEQQVKQMIQDSQELTKAQFVNDMRRRRI